MLPAFFQNDNSGGFALYDHSHIAWLVCIASVCVALAAAYRLMHRRARRAAELTLGIAALLLELSELAVLALQGDLGIGYLPLHLCGISVFVEFAACLHPCDQLRELMYAVCMPGALAALLFPDWTMRPMDTFLCISCFIVHGILVAYPMMLTASGAFRPSAKRLPGCLAFLAAVSIPIYFFNKKFDTNYMFLNWPSAGSPLEWFADIWGDPGYLLGFPVMLAAVWLILYIPWIASDLRRRDKGGTL